MIDEKETWQEPENLSFNVVQTAPPSEWRCELFGLGKEGIVWNPAEGNVPNRFWRVMQYLFFGNKWIKEMK